MTDATSILSYKITDLPNIRASLWIVRFRSLFLFSAFLSCLDLPSVSPHTYTEQVDTCVLVTRYPPSSFFILLRVDNARKSSLFSALSYIAARPRSNPRGRASRIPEVLHIGLGLE